MQGPMSLCLGLLVVREETMSKTLFGVYGAGGCGRGVLPIARKWLSSVGICSSRLVFIDDKLSGNAINGHEVLAYDEFLRRPAEKRQVAIAIADPRLRACLRGRCDKDGVITWTLCAQNTEVMDSVDLDGGAILSPFVTLTSNIKIGRDFHANLYSYIEHDCVIGDFVTFAPGVKCNGNVHIEDFVYVGSGAILRQGTTTSPLVIGQGAVIGMGAVVTKSVAPGSVMVGCPARPLKKAKS